MAPADTSDLSSKIAQVNINGDETPEQRETRLKELSKLPDKSDWNGPILVRLETHTRLGRKQWRTDGGCEGNITFNEPADKNVFEFETDLFKGRALLRFRGCPNEPSSYFEGRKRRQQWVVQGEFKETISADKVITGYEFRKPAQNLPTSFIIKPVLALIRTLAPTFQCDVYNDTPYFLNPFLQTVQVFDASLPGNEPDITKEFAENNKLLGGIFESGEVTDRFQRKNYFASDENGANHKFEKGVVYTFDFFEDRFDPAEFNLVLPFTTIDITPFLDAQPLTLMGKVNDPSKEYHDHYLFNFEIHHESQAQ